MTVLVLVLTVDEHELAGADGKEVTEETVFMAAEQGRPVGKRASWSVGTGDTENKCLVAGEVETGSVGAHEPSGQEVDEARVGPVGTADTGNKCLLVGEKETMSVGVLVTVGQEVAEVGVDGVVFWAEHGSRVWTGRGTMEWSGLGGASGGVRNGTWLGLSTLTHRNIGFLLLLIESENIPKLYLWKNQYCRACK